MIKLPNDYWKRFILNDENGNTKGNGIEFENLINELLTAIYGIEWKRTKKSHDDNRDFWLYFEEKHIWAECKNYKDSIDMKILAPTLVMAQIYEVNEILFFSRSKINSFAKDKIMTFGEKSNKNIIFYDAEVLDDLIWNYRNYLSSEYSPLNYEEKIDSEFIEDTCVRVYFFQNPVSNAKIVAESFQNYKNVKKIHYNETFALTLCVTNPFQEDDVEMRIDFNDESDERFSFQYFDHSIVSESKQWYKTNLKKGQGKAVSLNMRQIRFQRNIHLPLFRISFFNPKTKQTFNWFSHSVNVKCSWIGKTKIVGNNYLSILKQVEDRLICNPCVSCLVLKGSSGTGKTRLLEECQNIFLKNGYHVINFSGQKDFSSYYFFKEIITYLYEIPSAEILQLLEERKLFDYSENINTDDKKVDISINMLRMIIDNKTEDALQRVLKQFADIIFEKLSKEKNVLIIDNVQYAGSAFQYFIEHYIYYAVNQQSANLSVVLLGFNLDYMTNESTELLYNITHSEIKHLLQFPLEGFVEKEIGVQFMQELTRTNNDENVDYFKKIIEKVSLKPYNLYQTVKYLEEMDIIKISPNDQGYIISNLRKFSILSDIHHGITDVLKNRIQFISHTISIDRILLICSVMYLFDMIDEKIKNIFEIQHSELIYLCEKSIFMSKHHNLYFFNHDIIRNFFYQEYNDHVLDCLYWLKRHKRTNVILKYKLAYLLCNIKINKNINTTLDVCNDLSNQDIPERIASLFYNELLDSLSEIIEKQAFEGIYIKYIHQICTLIRQYDGSEKAWYVAKEMYDNIQTYCPYALSKYTDYYRPFIHFCCDIAVQSHFYEEEREFIKSVLKACKKAHPTEIQNIDELYILQAIMYNRWYISYNTESFKAKIKEEREKLINKSREYIDKITDPKKRGLIKYLNDSDEGYNFYGYEKDKKKLFEIWDYCICNIPKLVPEKTMNYYRKTVQYGLINQNKKTVEDETKKALQYLENGEFSHEPIIFQTFFDMAKVMSNLQHNMIESYNENAVIINDIMKMQELLNNHKLGDILLLKGVNGHYGGNKDEVYYAYKDAYKYYDSGETSRYWIKRDLLKENIVYSFTVLEIYDMGYDISCFPPECRKPLSNTKIQNFTASGIQRTGDLHLNLPLI